MLTVLGGLAEFERELIKARTAEGRTRAQARGVRFGRKLKLTPHQRQEAIARREAGEALVEIGRSYNVSHSTISRLTAQPAFYEYRARALDARYHSPGVFSR
jgi:DNA invertase Pin-like site-specific DNA recombinase